MAESNSYNYHTRRRNYTHKGASQTNRRKPNPPAKERILVEITIPEPRVRTDAAPRPAIVRFRERYKGLPF